MTRNAKVSETYFGILTENIKEHLHNGMQIRRLAVADLKKTYHGAALGWAWAVIKPVFTIFVYWFAIAIGLRKGSDVDGVPFILWLMSGVIPWFFMSDCITGGTECIRRYSYLVTKMKFPVMIIPTFTNLSRLFVHVVLVVAEIIVFWAAGYPPTVYLLQLPVYSIMMFFFFNSWALFAGMVSAIGKDFTNLVKSLNVAVFWLSGIIWNIENVVDNDFLYSFMMLNPVTFVCYGYRNSFINHVWFFDQPKRFMYFVIEYIALTAFALWAYKKLRKEIPDVL